MPFNPSGIFERLFSWSADRDNGVKILADRHDSEDNNLAAGINAILAGDQPFRGPIKGAFGTVSAPGFTFKDDTDTGFYRSAANTLAATAGGVKALEMTGTGASGGIFQTTPNDFATGKVPLAEYAQSNTIGTLITSATNLNTLTTPGKYYFTNVSRPTNLPSNYDGAWAGTVIVSKASDTTSPQVMLQEVHATQDAIFVNTASSWRRMTDGTFRTAWGMVYNQSNILDYVSQASGVPTGGLIERGSNGNGEYVRFADGTQICTTFINNDSAAWTTADGSLFRSGLSTWTYPAAFASGSSPAASGGVEVGSRPAGTHFVSLTAASVGWYGWAATSAASGVSKRVMLSAIGRWF